jgi:hypothetical protein
MDSQHVCKAILDCGIIVAYDLCGDSPNLGGNGLRLLGRGIIYSINNILCNNPSRRYFYIRSGSGKGETKLESA